MPVLTGDKATGVPVLDEMAFGRWPHLFTVLAVKYKVPDHFLITLLFLWEATMGKSASGSGDLAIPQIPVRERTARKWLAALCAAGFFEKDEVEPGDTTGATFAYNVNTTPKAWHKFFAAAAMASYFPNWDAVSPKEFATLLASAIQRRTPPPLPEVNETTRKSIVADWLAKHGK
jgi:hypothetical protein